MYEAMYEAVLGEPFLQSVLCQCCVGDGMQLCDWQFQVGAYRLQLQLPIYVHGLLSSAGASAVVCFNQCPST
jgi:hypothetical protein